MTNIIEQFSISNVTVKLYEYPEYKNIIGRSIYTMSAEAEGTAINGLGDDKEYALNYYNTFVDHLKTMQKLGTLK